MRPTHAIPSLSRRVDYAARCLLTRRTHTRGFDNCFEQDDGDAVVYRLMRRAQKNARLAQAIADWLTPEGQAQWQAIFDRLAGR